MGDIQAENISPAGAWVFLGPFKANCPALADGDHWGLLSPLVTFGEQVDAFLACSINASFQAVKADANDHINYLYPAVGLTVQAQANASTGRLLIFGWARNNSWTFTRSTANLGRIWLDKTTPGALVQTVHDQTDDRLHRIAMAWTANTAFFDFNQIMIRHA